MEEKASRSRSYSPPGHLREGGKFEAWPLGLRLSPPFVRGPRDPSTDGCRQVRVQGRRHED